MNNNRYSDLKIAWFPEKLASFRDGKITAPIYARIKPTNRCQHFCKWCAYNHGTIVSGMHETMDPREMIPRAKLLEVLWDLHEMGTKAVTFSGGGEPLSYPHITEAMRLCHNYGIDLSCITNGALLENDRAEVLRDAKWLRVSVDYSNAEQMLASRGVDQFDRVLRNMAAFAASGASCELGVNFIVTKENFSGIADMCGTLRDHGVANVRISPVWFQNFREYHDPIASLVNLQIEAARARYDSASFRVYSSYDLDNPAHGKERTFPKCWFMQMVPVIGADQQIFACHNTAYSSHGAIGSIKTQRFKDLWFSEETKRFMDNFSTASCSHQCAAHSKIENVNALLEAAGDSFV